MSFGSVTLPRMHPPRLVPPARRTRAYPCERPQRGRSHTLRAGAGRDGDAWVLWATLAAALLALYLGG